MKNTLFIFSDSYKILNQDELKSFEDLDLTAIGGHDEWQKIHNGEAFVVSSTNYKYQYIINPTIKYFLEQFVEKPISFPTVLSKIATSVNVKTKVIQPVIEPFFITMVENGILEFYKENEPAQTIDNQSDKTIFELGQTIENYKINTLLSQKKEAEIYTAEDLKTNNEVVVKVMRYDQIFPPKLKNAIAYFKQEFEMMKHLSHANICRYVDFYSDENLTFGVMQYVKGRSPRTVLKNRQLSLSEKLHIFQQTVSAVAYMHRKKMIHGDIHASNFMVTDDNKVTLIDFGFTQFKNSRKNKLTIEGGTIAYLPPECVHQNSFDVITQRVDYQGEVYQLGVVAYILLYEQKPFRGLTWKQLAENIQTQKIDFPKSTPNREKIPKYIRNILKKALRKNPRKRFKNAGKMLEEFDI